MADLTQTTEAQTPVFNELSVFDRVERGEGIPLSGWVVMQHPGEDDVMLEVAEYSGRTPATIYSDADGTRHLNVKLSRVKSVTITPRGRTLHTDGHHHAAAEDLLDIREGDPYAPIFIARPAEISQEEALDLVCRAIDAQFKAHGRIYNARRARNVLRNNKLFHWLKFAA